MKCGFLLTDEEDWVDKLLIRVFGFTILGIANIKRDWFSLTILGFWVQWRLP